MTLRDSCGFPVAGYDNELIEVTLGVVAPDNYGLCCDNQEPLILDAATLIPEYDTDANGQTEVDLEFGGGHGIVTVQASLEQGALILGTVSWEIRSPDFDGDCVVSPSDFLGIATKMGSSDPEDMYADLDFDGDIDPSDFTIFASHFGHKCGSSRTQPIPAYLLAQQQAREASDNDIQMFSVEANVPNPFNPLTTIAFAVPEDRSHVRVTIFNAAGRLIRTLVDERFDEGRYSAVWDGTTDNGNSAPSGVYFYRVEGPGFADERKMVLVK